MIQPAKFIDVPSLVELLVEQQRTSIYADKVAVDRDYTRKFLAALVHKHGGIHDGGTCVFLAKADDGAIIGFVAGMLNRVYHIGIELMAQDAFLVVRPKAPPSTVIRLVDAYTAWAETSPKVREIQLSHSAAIPGSERIAGIYRRKGFVPFGRSYRKEIIPLTIERKAA